MAPGFECWNLRKMTFDEFISEVRGATPQRRRAMPLERFLFDHYGRIKSKVDNDIDQIKAAWKPYYDLASWGLLVRTKTNPWARKVNAHIHFPITDQYLEDNALFLINLFSPLASTPNLRHIARNEKL